MNRIVAEIKKACANEAPRRRRRGRTEKSRVNLYARAVALINRCFPVVTFQAFRSAAPLLSPLRLGSTSGISSCCRIPVKPDRKEESVCANSAWPQMPCSRSLVRPWYLGRSARRFSMDSSAATANVHMIMAMASALQESGCSAISHKVRVSGKSRIVAQEK